MKNILIAVTGLTPQIVTETFFCLAKLKKVNIDEIYVITTKLGREVILGKYKNSSAYKLPLKAEIKNMCAKWKLPVPKFEVSSNVIVAQEESLELNDIRSDKDNLLFPNKTAEFIRKMSEDPGNVLYCSISGGRKSMGVHLAAALQIFGRENDKLLHVLTSEKNEFKGFYPMNTKEARELELSEIPFVSLRPLIMSGGRVSDLSKFSFTQLVERTRTELKKLSDPNKLVIDIIARKIKYLGAEVSLEPVEIGLYFKFFSLKKEEKYKVSINQIMSKEFSNSILDFLVENYNYSAEPFDKNLRNKKWYHTGFSREAFLTKKSNINEKIEELIADKNISQSFTITVDKLYRDSQYYVEAPPNRFSVIYKE